MTRKELILKLLDGKKMTSDSFASPDKVYISYNEEIRSNPFRISFGSGKETIGITNEWDMEDWREVVEKPYSNPKTGIEDKSFIEAWDDNKIQRTYTFYDAFNDCIFKSDGSRNGVKYDNYRVVKNVPNWAIELKKELR